MCQNRKIDNGLAGDFFMGSGLFFEGSQAAEGEKETPGQESRGQRCKELTGCWTMGSEFIFYFAFAHAMHGSVTSQAAASRPFLYRSPHIAGQNPLL